MPLDDTSNDPIALRTEAARLRELATTSRNERVRLALETMAAEMEARAAALDVSTPLPRSSLRRR